MPITILQSNANKASILTQQHPTLEKLTLPKNKHVWEKVNDESNTPQTP